MTIEQRIAEHEQVLAESHAQLNEAALLLGCVIVGGLLLMVLWSRYALWHHRRRVAATARHERQRRLRGSEPWAWDAVVDWSDEVRL